MEPIQTDSDYRSSLAELEGLWGAPRGTPAGARLDSLLDLIETYELKHYPLTVETRGPYSR